MLKQCGYCRKSIDEGKEVKNTLLYLQRLATGAQRKGILFQAVR
ncbi:Gifsy-1 prophage protein [Salmonella enterica subsp. enterica]|nr:Gifsy-1 prophage protein [Salmonella enterica subsp. enterica]